MTKMAEEVWGRWKFSPRLEPELQQLASLSSFGGTLTYSFQLKNNQERVITPVNATEPIVNNDECVQEVQYNSTNKSMEEPSSSIMEQDSVVADSLLDMLDKRPATSEELSTASVDQLIPLFPDLSDTAMLHFCQAVCGAGPQDQGRFGRLLFTHLLLPRLQDSTESCSRQMLAALQQTVDCFPHQASAELLVPLLLMQSANHSMVETLVSPLNMQNKLVVLRLFVESDITQLSEWQLPALQHLIVPTTEDRLNQQLVTLLGTSAKNFLTNVKFGRLLVTVIQQIGPNLSATLRDQIALIVSQHKSLMKKMAEKALKAL